MSLENELKRAVANEAEKATPVINGWSLLEPLGYFLALVNLPLAIVVVVISMAGSLLKEGKSLSSEQMPDDWLKAVSESDQVSKEGLAFLSKKIARQGHITVSDGIKFIEIEKESSASKKKEAYIAKGKDLAGAKAIIDKAKKECGNLLDNCSGQEC